ncbi:hypothetical protein [uncultured Roseibium sp.]|uniref:hypothetical protein n=1 Tax=uncultured Roseibium sp. TaxID=1936171 RepID=UPI00321626FB
MTFSPRFSPLSVSFEPETFLSLAREIQALRSTGRPSGSNRLTSPIVTDWSKTLLPFPAIIGSLGATPVLEPVFAFSDDNSCALLSSGWVRLENHVDVHLEGHRPIGR